MGAGIEMIKKLRQTLHKLTLNPLLSKYGLQVNLGSLTGHTEQQGPHAINIESDAGSVTIANALRVANSTYRFFIDACGHVVCNTAFLINGGINGGITADTPSTWYASQPTNQPTMLGVISDVAGPVAYLQTGSGPFADLVRGYGSSKELLHRVDCLGKLTICGGGPVAIANRYGAREGEIYLSSDGGAAGVPCLVVTIGGKSYPLSTGTKIASSIIDCNPVCRASSGWEYMPLFEHYGYDAFADVWPGVAHFGTTYGSQLAKVENGSDMTYRGAGPYSGTARDGSILFANGDYMQAASAASYDDGAGGYDYVWRFIAKTVAVAAGYGGVAGKMGGSPAVGWVFGARDTNFGFQIWRAGAPVELTSGALSAGTYYDVMVFYRRSTGLAQMYVDGVASGSPADLGTAAFSCPASKFQIGNTLSWGGYAGNVAYAACWRGLSGYYLDTHLQAACAAAMHAPLA